MTTGSRTVGRPQDERLDVAILAATLALLAEKGYAQTSIEAVARGAGTAKTSIYRRWPNKEALVVAALTLDHDAITSLPVPDTGSLRDDLIAYGLAAFDTMDLDRMRVLAGLFTVMTDEPELAQLVRQEISGRNDLALRTMVDRAVARGELLAGDYSPLLTDVLPAVHFALIMVKGLSAGRELAVAVADGLIIPILRGSVISAAAG